MKVRLDYDVYKWIAQAHLLPPMQVKPGGKVDLDEDNSRKFMNGVKVGELLQYLDNTLNFEMKDQNGLGIKLYNWNLISEAFAKLNIPFDNDIKTLIVQGDTEMINEVMKDVISCNLKQSNASYQPQFEQTSQSLIEYLELTISKHFQIKQQQAQALLSNGNKYLAHVMVKGAKSDFAPIQNWLADLYTSLKIIEEYFKQDDINLSIFLQAVKPGLVSKDQEVTRWSLRIYNKVLFDLQDMDMHAVGYDWFSNHGLNASLMCIKRHPDLVQQLSEVFVQGSKYNLNDFFTVQLRKQLDFGKEYLDFINTILPYLSQSKQMKEDLVTAGLVQFWADQSLKYPETDNMIALKYLTLYWQIYPISFEEDSNLATQFLFLMKKATRNRSDLLKYFSLQNLFMLLEQFANDRNPYAGILYKKLTFSLIENYEELEVRDWMLNLFMNLFSKYSSIPIEILLEPLIKELMVNEVQVNMSDLALMKQCSVHPKMKIKLGIQLLDLLSKIYFNDIVFSKLSLPIIKTILHRFQSNAPIQEYSFKLVKVGLGFYHQSKKNSGDDIIEAQKRAQIIELIKFIQNMKDIEDLKEIIVHFHIELGRKDRGLIALLQFYGNVDITVREIELKWQEEQVIEKAARISQMVEKKEETQDNLYVNADQENEFGIKFDQQSLTSIQQIEVKQEARSQSLKKKKSTKVDNKVLEKIAEIKLKREEDQQLKKMEEQEKQKKEKMMQKKAQEEIQKRNQKRQVEEQTEQEKQKEELINVDEEENRDGQSIKISLKKNQKAIKYLFSKYSNTTNQAQKKDLFGEIQEQFGSISKSDIWRMCKDYNISELFDRDQIMNLAKAINHKDLDFKQFEQFLIQLAIRTYSTQERDLRKHPLGKSLDELIFQFGQVAKRKNENHLIFNDPQNLNIDPDRQEIISLNEALRQDPETIIPSKYQKVNQKEMSFSYLFRPDVGLNVPSDWLDCYELVNDIISETFNVEIMEPISQVNNIFQVKHKPQYKQETKMSNKSRQQTRNQIMSVETLDDEAKKKGKYQKWQETPPIRSQKISKTIGSKREQIQNKAIEEKQRKKEYEEMIRLDQEEKRKKHSEVVIINLQLDQLVKQQYLQFKAQKEQEEQKRKEDERQQQIEKYEKEKREQERLKKEAEIKKNKLREYKEKMEEERKKKELEDIELNKIKEEQKRKEHEEFMKKQKKEVQQMILQKEKQFKDKEEQEKKREKERQDEMQEWKKNINDILKEDKNQRQREKEGSNKITQLYISEPIQEVFKNNQKSLQQVYHSYQDYSDWKIENAEYDKDLLSFKGYTNFASQFNIYPGIITVEQCQLVFHNLARERERYQQILNEKNGYNQAPPNGMSYREFEQALLRFAILGQKSFDTISDKNQKMKQLDMLNIVKDQKNQENGQENKDHDDIYTRVDHTSAKTLQGLIQFLELPDDKNELQSKLRALKLEYQKVVAPRDKKKSKNNLIIK